MSDPLGVGIPPTGPILPPRPITPTDFQRVSSSLRSLDDALRRESAPDVSVAGDEFRASLGGNDLPTTLAAISTNDRIPVETKELFRKVLRTIPDAIHVGLTESRKQDKEILDSLRGTIQNLLSAPPLHVSLPNSPPMPAPPPVPGELEELLHALARRTRDEELRAPLIAACSEWVRAYDRDISTFCVAIMQMWDYSCDWRLSPDVPPSFDPGPWIPNLLIVGRLVRERNWHELIAKGTAPDSPAWEALTYRLLRVAAAEGATEATLATALAALANAGKLSLISWQHPFNFLNVAVREQLAPDRAKAFPDLYPSPATIPSPPRIPETCAPGPTSPNGPTPDSPPNLAELRARCYPPVPPAELRPLYPRPPEAEIAAAMKAVPHALTDSRFAGEARHLSADPSERFLAHAAWLAFAEERGHGRPAAEWAIYRLVEDDRLCVVWPSIEHPRPGEDRFQQAERFNLRIREQTERYRGGKPATVANWDLFACGKVLELRSTPRLWEWFAAGCPSDRQESPQPVTTLPGNTDGNEPTPEENALKAKLAGLEPRVRVAYLQYNAAARDLGDPTDESAYLEAKVRFSDGGIPVFDTWVRYVREARNQLGEQKNQRRKQKIKHPAIVRSAIRPDGRAVGD